MNDDPITAEMIAGGDVFVDVFAMIQDGPDMSRLIEGRHETPNFYDVMLRPEVWEDNDHEPYGEWDDLTLDQANAKVAELEEKYPGINVNWVD